MAILKLTMFSIICYVLITIILIIFKKKIQTAQTKDFILKIIVLTTITIHYSTLFINLFVNKKLVIEDNMILPVYPCNVIMWLSLIVAFIKDKQSKIFRYLAEFTFLAGTVCSILGFSLNFNFLNNPNFLNISIMRGLLSHVTLLLGCLYLYVMDYVSIHLISNIISGLFGALIFYGCGIYVNLLYYFFGKETPNAMYMIYSPFKEIPFLNFYTMVLLGLIVLFSLCAVYEQFKYPKEKRWYYIIKEKRKEKHA